MNGMDKLKQRLNELQRLTRFQRILRMGLRAFWLGMGGVMLGWGLNALWGWLPGPPTWLLLGAAFAAAPLIGLARSLPRRGDWVWRLDRRLGLREQVSTAWAVLQAAESGGEDAPVEQTGNVPRLLIEDVNRILPRVRRRVIQRGWYLEIDLVSTLIVIVLGMLLLASGLLRPYSDLLGDAPAAIAAPAMPPPFDLQVPQEEGAAPEQAPGQAPGDGGGQGEQPQPGESGGQQPDPGGQQPDDEQNPGAGAVGEILRELGRQISPQAGTYDLGQALEDMNLNGAAEALEDLALQLDDLSGESRDNLAEALQNAAEALEQSGESPAAGGGQPLQEDMRSAAEALQGEQNQSAAESLDEMAGELRDLAQELGQSEMAGGGAGDNQGGGAGSPEPLSRLDGENGDMELPLTDPSGSSLLTPGGSDLDGDGLADGALPNSGLPGDDAVQSPLLPGSLLWKWRNVVSQYFQR